MRMILCLRHLCCVSVLAFMATGCESDEELQVINEFEFTQNNQTVRFVNSEFFGNENCGKVFVTASVTTDDDPNFHITFELTPEGWISDVLFVDYSDNNRHFQTAKYIPSEVFFITNFNLTETSLRFDFSGILYEDDYKNTERHIEGTVDMDDFPYVQCSYEPWEIEAEINDKPFRYVEMVGISSDERTKWISFSDDGFKISIITAEKLEDMPVGSYPFTSDDLLNRVTIEKYTGSYQSYGLVEDSVWEQNQYEGELIIEEQGSQTSGRFVLKAKKDNEVIYEISNGYFRI